MKRLGVPRVIFNLHMMVTAVSGKPVCDIDCIDFFAGAARIKKSFRSLGFQAISYEKTDDPSHQDLLSFEGFITALIFVMRLKPSGITHWGTVCSTWVWVSRGATKRSAATPLGDQGMQCVREAICMQGASDTQCHAMSTLNY